MTALAAYAEGAADGKNELTVVWSQQAIEVMAVFTSSTASEFHGYALAKQTGIAAQTIYDILGRFEDFGWLLRREEAIYSGRPARCFYQLTDAGLRNAVGKVNA